MYTKQLVKRLAINPVENNLSDVSPQKLYARNSMKGTILFWRKAHTAIGQKAVRSPKCIKWFVFLMAFFSAHLVANDLIGLPEDPDSRPDFSGSWEKDYRRSDDWEKKLNLKILEIRRDIARQSQRRTGEPSFSSAARGRNGTNIIDLGRFAELISRSNDIHITQTDSEVRIKRDGEADLICGTGHTPLVSDSGELGSEACGWNGQQLIFKINLPGDIGIHHQFTVAPEKDAINLLTRVSNGESMSFELVQFFNRYHSNYQDYSCRQTLTKGKVCSWVKK